MIALPAFDKVGLTDFVKIDARRPESILRETHIGLALKRTVDDDFAVPVCERQRHQQT